MELKLSRRDVKILLMFLGLLIFFCSYYFVYRPMVLEAQDIAVENEGLQSRLSSLLEMSQNKEFYVKEIRFMQEKIGEYCKQFPPEVRQEDGIVLSQNMEAAMEVQISNIGFGEKEIVISMDGSDGGEDIAPEQTWSERANEKTQTQINEIEGVTELKEFGVDEIYNPVTGVPVLYRNRDTFQFTCTYEGLKDVIRYLASQEGRMTVDTINTSFDSATGNLTGSMMVNLFSMSGIDSVYTDPDAGTVNYGTQNIFGSLGSIGRRTQQDPEPADAGQEEEDTQTEGEETEDMAEDAS